MCAKSDNFLNCCDQSMHRVLQDRYSGCDVTYSGCDVIIRIYYITYLSLSEKFSQDDESICLHTDLY